ncbi:hypothetical protein RND71_009565 [Anisodus tanguticus]|uniref:Pentatricopeptide repeat-containing protein n=1 Tax=Anisodus tanguticus TaxID=243964 RepID=A0AAE1VRX7_9SOLA|nr:hypothetical protein RND71_009565 [Anisodus tanguticus]
MANAYAASGRWGDFAQVRKKMKERNVKKVPGFSEIEVNGKNHTMDKMNPDLKGEIEKKLNIYYWEELTA